MSGILDKTIIIWNLENGEIIRILKGHSGWVTFVVISHDGQTIVSVKRAYRNLARQYHPDLNQSKSAKTNMQTIVEAYKNFRRK